RVSRRETGSGLCRAVRRPARTLCRPPLAALSCRAADRGAARRRGTGHGRAGVVQARRTEPYRRTQDQQLHRPDPAGDPHGQDADHRGNGGGAAWRRHRDRVRALWPAVHHLHGRQGRRAAGAERVPHEAAGRGSARGGKRRAHVEGRDERGTARLGRQRPRHLLHHRHRRRTAPLSRTGPRLPERDRARGARADAGAHRAAARPAGRRDRRRIERDRAVPCVPGRQRRRDAGRRGGRRRSGRAPCRQPGGRLPRRAPRQQDLSAAGRRRPDRGGAFDLRRSRLSGHRPRTCVAEGYRPRRIHVGHRSRGAGRLPAFVPDGGDHPCAGTGARDRGGHAPRAGDARGS
ncbi:hypothetical protein LTR94_027961, partial [Friedmanniomyces endolithicus]